jgi:hypothetical protein
MTSGKWFRRTQNCFVARMPTKYSLELSNSFNRLKLAEAPSAIAQKVWFIGLALAATIDAERLFNTCLVDKPRPQPATVEPKASRGLLNRTTCNLFRQLRVVELPSTKDGSHGP